MLNELLRCEIAQSLVRVNGIVDGFPHQELLIQRVHGPLQVRHLVELFLMGALGALDVPIQLRRGRLERTGGEGACLVRTRGRSSADRQAARL